MHLELGICRVSACYIDLINKSALMHDFIERTPAKDEDEKDRVYAVTSDGIKAFLSCVEAKWSTIS